jgi:N6-L-threonylcarbamoyladenine synthase
MKILSIETSCDETGAAVIEGDKNDTRVELLSNVIVSSLELHAETGGIIPEIAARKQVEFIIPIIKQALEKAKLDPTYPAIDALAVTYGPGLIGSLLVGVETIKTLSFTWQKPIIPVNHLYGHIYANFIKTDDTTIQEIKFPALALVVSGGHTDLVLLKKHGELDFLGGTLDDAAGECFDKCARLLGYNYPGGPKISELAQKGNPSAFSLPRPMMYTKDYNFSFSGLKTAFLNLTKQHFPVLRKDIPNTKGGWQQVTVEKELKDTEKQQLYDLCAALEQAIIDVLVKKTLAAATQYNVNSILLSGGVAANKKLRQELEIKSEKIYIPLYIPPPYLCTDNAAMIGSAAFFNNTPTSWKNLAANPELYFD